jgi:hypothetical protein
MSVDGDQNYFYHRKPKEEGMARPPKDKRLLMNIPLRIMLTTEQKALIEEAARLSQLDMAAWARPILLQVAQDQLAGSRRKRGRQK